MKLTKRNDVDFSGEVLIYDSAQESNPRFKHEATVSAGYTELTSISDWNNYAMKAIPKYSDFRNELIAVFTDWATYSDDDKKILITHYVWPSTETTANLDLLYTQTERDEFLIQCIILLNGCSFNFHIAPDGTYWNILPDATGSLLTGELKTDEQLDSLIGGKVACRVFTTAGQSITDSAWNTVNWASESHDAKDMHDNITNNSRIEIKSGEDGLYLITSSLSFASDVTGNRGIRLQKNGAGEVRRVLTPNAGTGNFVTIQVSDAIELVGGDYLEIAAWQSSGVALALLTGADRNHFSVVKLR